MKYSFSLLWIAFFSWSSVIYGEECPANKAIYTSITDSTKIFEATGYATYTGWYCQYYYEGEEDIPNTELVLYPYKLYDKDSPYRNAGRDIPEIENYKKGCEVTLMDQVTKGLFNGEVVYYWFQRATTDSVGRSLSEEEIKKDNSNSALDNILDRIVWLDDASVPKADMLIIPRYWNIHEVPIDVDYSNQVFGKDIMALTGCGQNKNLYENKYIDIGLKEAEETNFYDIRRIFGRPSEVGDYDNGVKVGLWKYYDNAGRLWIKGSYKNGKKDGLWTTYDTDGSISETATWVDGKLEGA